MSGVAHEHLNPSFLTRVPVGQSGDSKALLPTVSLCFQTHLHSRAHGTCRHSTGQPWQLVNRDGFGGRTEAPSLSSLRRHPGERQLVGFVALHQARQPQPGAGGEDGCMGGGFAQGPAKDQPSGSRSCGRPKGTKPPDPGWQ